jgi:hypothetical protein
MLNDHTHQLGIEFTENAPRFLGAPSGDLPLAFPELEQQLNLPAEAGKQEGFVQGEQQ